MVDWIEETIGILEEHLNTFYKEIDPEGYYCLNCGKLVEEEDCDNSHGHYVLRSGYEETDFQGAITLLKWMKEEDF